MTVTSNPEMGSLLKFPKQKRQKKIGRQCEALSFCDSQRLGELISKTFFFLPKIRFCTLMVAPSYA